MAKKFRGPEIIKEIDEALDKGLARFLFRTQAKLSKDAPVDSGRMASSWFIGMNQPNREVEPEHDERFINITKDYTQREITMKSNWYISSNLDYSERVCLNPKWSKNGAGGQDWFTKIVNGLDKDAGRAFQFFLRKVK